MREKPKRYLKDDDEAEKHPESFPRIELVEDERNVLVLVIFHPQLTAKSSD